MKANNLPAIACGKSILYTS